MLYWFYRLWEQCFFDGADRTPAKVTSYLEYIHIRCLYAWRSRFSHTNALALEKFVGSISA